MLDELLGTFDPQETFQDCLMLTTATKYRGPKQPGRALQPFAWAAGAFLLLSLLI